MKSYLVTNPNFTGEITLMYNDADLLVSIDLIKSTMKPDTIAAFKRAVPVIGTPENFATAFSAATTIVATDVTITWEMFYKNWPHKRNAFEGKKFWAKMSKTDQVEAYYNQPDYIAYSKWQQSRFEYQPMMADKWLRRREYETNWKQLMKAR